MSSRSHPPFMRFGRCRINRQPINLAWKIYCLKKDRKK
ncbi:MAG: hypothetical protein DMF73_12600 [Acidobacteria bacterium]|nr:MAG: hypothetical protein DMF73_12600 [Acidobacteriota bacterium]